MSLQQSPQRFKTEREDGVVGGTEKCLHTHEQGQRQVEDDSEFSVYFFEVSSSLLLCSQEREDTQLSNCGCV